jgi:hypothetical protein
MEAIKSVLLETLPSKTSAVWFSISSKINQAEGAIRS